VAVCISTGTWCRWLARHDRARSGLVSGLSQPLSSGRCIAAAAAPTAIKLRTIDCHELGIDLPGRFGWRCSWWAVVGNGGDAR
jgi:hypothetical protein